MRKFFASQAWLGLAMKTRKAYEKKKYEEALGYAEKALKKAEDVFGDKHLNTNRSLYNLAVMQSCMEMYEEAEQSAKRALEITEGNWGKNHIKLIDDLRNLISVYEKWGEKPEELAEVEERLEKITSGECDVDGI